MKKGCLIKWWSERNYGWENSGKRILTENKMRMK